MPDETTLDSTLDSIAASLDSLESTLGPLLDHPLEESLAAVNGPAERAKLLFWLSYIIHSTSWVYTKLRAVDPEGHGVLEELKRIQGYNGKIRALESQATAQAEGSSSSQDGPSMKIDKDAASRFIRAAISNQPNKPSSSSSFYTAKADVSDPLSGPGKHSRFQSIEKSSRNLKGKNKQAESDDSDSDSGGELVVVGGDLAAPEKGNVTILSSSSSSSDSSSDDGGASAAKAQGKKRKWNAAGEVEDVEGASSQAQEEGKKKAQDPLKGYDSPSSATSSKASKNAKKKAKNGAKSVPSEAGLMPNSPAGTDSEPSSKAKKGRKGGKKKK